jgi:hypothetical protein
MTSPLPNLGLKRTTSRPLPPTMLPPPQSQNNCADAGPVPRPATATTAPAAIAAWRSKRAMIIVLNSLILRLPSSLAVNLRRPGE